MRFSLPAIAKHEDPAMLEKATHQTAHPNPAADSPYSGTKGARTANDQFDVHARLRGPIERLDDVFVEQGIHFRDEEGGAAGSGVSGLALDQADTVLAKVQWRDRQRSVMRTLGIRSQVVENVVNGLGNF